MDMSLGYQNFDYELELACGNVSVFRSESRQKNEAWNRIARTVNKHIPKSGVLCDQSKLEELKTNGIVDLKEINLTKNQVDNIIKHFSNIPVYNAHVHAKSDDVRRYLNHGAKNYNFGSYFLLDTMQCPYLLEIALNPNVLALVEQYLGCTPTIFSLNTWWSFPGFSPSAAQDFHRDADDFKFLTLFIYLTDIEGGESGGQHQFITKTHDETQTLEILNNDTELTNSLFLPKLKEMGYFQSKLYEKLFKNQIKEITGPAGSIFLADTYGLHKGVPPKTKDRLVCWIRYGLRKSSTYDSDNLEPIPFHLVRDRVTMDIRTQHILRAMVTCEKIKPPIFNILTKQGIRKVRLSTFNWDGLNYESNEFMISRLLKIYKNYSKWI